MTPGAKTLRGPGRALQLGSERRHPALSREQSGHRQGSGEGCQSCPSLEPSPGISVCRFGLGTWNPLCPPLPLSKARAPVSPRRALPFLMGRFLRPLPLLLGQGPLWPIGTRAPVSLCPWPAPRPGLFMSGMFSEVPSAPHLSFTLPAWLTSPRSPSLAPTVGLPSPPWNP